jgi:WD40 repeat protein
VPNDDKTPAPFEPRETHALEVDRQIAVARWSPDGNVLLTGGYDGLLRRWDTTADEPRELESITGHHGWVENVVALRSPASSKKPGFYCVTADSWGQLCNRHLDGENVEIVWQHEAAHDGWIRDLDVTPDGNRVVTCGRDRAVRVWSTADGKLVREFTGHANDLFTVAVHPNGEQVVVADQFGRLLVWDVATGERVREIDTAIAYSNNDSDIPPVRVVRYLDAARLLAAGSHPNSTNNQQGKPTILIHDAATGERTQLLEQADTNQGFVYDVALHAEGFLVLVTSGTPGKGQLLLWRLDEKQPFHAVTKMFNCHALALHPGGKRLVVTATNRNSQGNGTVLDKEGKYLGNTSPVHFFELG